MQVSVSENVCNREHAQSQVLEFEKKEKHRKPKKHV